jgi:hypothetical protein
MDGELGRMWGRHVAESVVFFLHSPAEEKKTELGYHVSQLRSEPEI